MGKTYLRYVPSSTYGVVVSPGSQVVAEPSGNLLFTGQLENVGVWNVKRGIQVSAQAGTWEWLHGSLTSGTASPPPFSFCPLVFYSIITLCFLLLFPLPPPLSITAGSNARGA